MAVSVSLLGETNATELAHVGPLATVHAGVVHHVAELSECARTLRALEDLVQSTSHWILSE